MLNADMEFYKLAGIGDIGEIVVHLDIRPETRQARRRSASASRPRRRRRRHRQRGRQRHRRARAEGAGDSGSVLAALERRNA